MTTFPNSPKVLKGGFVLLDPVNGAVQRIITLQYNADTLSRTLRPQGIAADGEDGQEATGLKGPLFEFQSRAKTRRGLGSQLLGLGSCSESVPGGEPEELTSKCEECQEKKLHLTCS